MAKERPTDQSGSKLFRVRMLLPLVAGLFALLASVNHMLGPRAWAWERAVLPAEVGIPILVVVAVACLAAGIWAEYASKKDA